QDDLAIGTPIAGRNRAELEGLIGFFVNTLVLRTDLSAQPGASGRSAGPTFRELLARVRSTALGAFAHQDLPFEKVVEELQPERDTSRTPLFEVMLVLQNTPAATLELPGLRLAPLPFEEGSAKFDLNLALVPAPSGLTGALTYKPDLFDRATIDRLAGHLLTLLAGAAADPEVPLAELPLLTEPERQALREWNATAAGPPTACLHELVAAQARCRPEAVAVTFEGTALSYGELDARAVLLSWHLRRLGVGPEVLAGVCVERSLALVVGLLAVLRSGGAYLPLDPSYPRERLARMLEDARPAVLLVEERTAALLPEGGCPRIFLDAPLASASGSLPVPAELPAGPENLAYVIFTSGSTGRPKGAMNSHRAIVNRLLWMQEQYRIGPGDRVLQKTPASFDVSVWELFWPLLTGACLVVARPGGHQDPAYLARTLEEREITTLHFVPAMLQVFLGEPEVERTTALRQVMSSGEALPAALAERFFARLPGVLLHNLYGPTEAAVDVTYWTCAPGAGVVPIGRPVANTVIRLLDASLRPVPVGVPGELCIGGVQLARGYLGRPELTAERFVPDPQAAGARLYRTGDLARHRSGGEIEYLGRLDHQVKIRGIRIELGEIEAALAAEPGVQEAVVVVREDEPGDRRLVAYVVARPAGSPGAGALREALQRRLPEPLVPSAIVALAAFPLTVNGKVDRKALPAPEAVREAARGAAEPTAVLAPQNPVEEVLCGIWEEVLRLPRVG
ncbi:MAG TPA: amino acid adenylation domain-containing protein, partial [Thermoanaerobaculia bacterium]|nr:amino acid adenylation domain-containing protein [Thermoanaerobaculia bacterium]